jgi:putative ribosome biogenesis GTPase RsgA
MSDIQSCQRCRGSGIILADGAYRACPDCSPPDASQSSLLSLDDEAAWGYSNADDRQRWAEILASARDYATKPQGWLVLYGEAGSGKTTLLRAIAQRMRQHGHNAVSYTHLTLPTKA